MHGKKNQPLAFIICKKNFFKYATYIHIYENDKLWIFVNYLCLYIFKFLSTYSLDKSQMAEVKVLQW